MSLAKDGNIYTLKISDVLSLGATEESRSNVVRIKVVLNSGESVDSLTRDNTVQMRLFNENETKVWAKADKRKPVSYSDYTQSTTISKMKEMGRLEEFSTGYVTTQTSANTKYDGETQKLEVNYTYNNQGYLLASHRPYALSYKIPAEIYNMIKDGDSIKVYVINHNSDKVTNGVVLNKSEFKEVDGGYILKMSEGGYNSADGSYFTNIGSGTNSIYHQSVTINPAGIRLELDMDIAAIADSFSPDDYMDQYPIQIQYTSNSAPEIYRGTFENEITLTKGTEVTVEFPVNGILNLVSTLSGKKLFLRYGDFLIPQKGVDAGYGKTFKFVIPRDVTIPAGSDVSVFSDTTSKSKNTQGTLKIGETSITLPKLTSGSNAVLANTNAFSTIMLEKTFYLPKIDDIFTDDTSYKGFVKYPGAYVYGRAPSETEYSNVLSGTTPNPQEDNAYPFTLDKSSSTELLKDMPINFRVADYRNSKIPSDLVTQKVKARVTFDLNDGGTTPNKVVVAPENLKYSNDEGYQPNGLDYNGVNEMPDFDESTADTKDDPTREGYTFNGWNTKIDGSGETFTKDTPITKHLTVYAQWTRSYQSVVKYFKDGVEDVSLETVGTVPATDPKISIESLKRIFQGLAFIVQIQVRMKMGILL